MTDEDWEWFRKVHALTVDLYAADDLLSASLIGREKHPIRFTDIAADEMNDVIFHLIATMVGGNMKVGKETIEAKLIEFGESPPIAHSYVYD